MEISRSQNGRKNSSFSSTLFDAIYRSIGDECDSRGGELILYRETRKLQVLLTRRRTQGNDDSREILQGRTMGGEEREREGTQGIWFRRWVLKICDFNSSSSSSYFSYEDFSSSKAESICKLHNFELHINEAKTNPNWARKVRKTSPHVHKKRPIFQKPTCHHLLCLEIDRRWRKETS